MDQHNVDKNVTLVMAEEAAPVVHLTAVPKAPAVVAAAANRGRPSGSKNKKVRHMAKSMIRVGYMGQKSINTCPSKQWHRFHLVAGYWVIFRFPAQKLPTLDIFCSLQQKFQFQENSR